MVLQQQFNLLPSGGLTTTTPTVHHSATPIIQEIVEITSSRIFHHFSLSARGYTRSEQQLDSHAGLQLQHTYYKPQLARFIVKSQKDFSEQKQAHVGMEPSKTSQTRWEWHHITFTPSLHLVPFCQRCALHLLYAQKGCGRQWSGKCWVCSACIVVTTKHSKDGRYGF